MKTLYFDCFSGISGDMFVGALLDLGVDFASLKAALDSLDVTGYAISAKKVKKKGVMATQFTVELDPGTKQPHRHLRHVVEIIDRGALDETVKEASRETFRRIAESEAQVHGSTIEKVHFHEVGAIDSIVDVVGAHFCLHALSAGSIVASPLHVGAGTVECAHGVMPVPAPATALLLRGIPSYGGEVQAELVTPTGAALIGQVAASFGAMPGMKIENIGYGSGTRDLEDRANVLRVLIGESAESSHAGETVTIIETNIDDMVPELLPVLVEQTMAAGARDVFITPVTCKKGRPGHLVTIMCDAPKVDELAAVVFRNSTTLGVRMREEKRICLEREWKTAQTPWGNVRIKLGRFGAEQTVSSPEFEDCRKVAESAGVPVLQVYHAALAAAVHGKLVS
ncbi:MAG: nickel pincer cofactor biosynthesis protein LarC [Candidatus Hydrogenedentes bacterium]|nr:nickel pincer cofactor biosynthesis protein LarC [Candidatus Hydrogenedentota bacterium]